MWGRFLKDHSKLRSLLGQLPRLYRHLKNLNTEGEFINQHKLTHLKRAVLAKAHSRPTTSTAVTLRVLRGLRSQALQTAKECFHVNAIIRHGPSGVRDTSARLGRAVFVRLVWSSSL